MGKDSSESPLEQDLEKLVREINHLAEDSRARESVSEHIAYQVKVLETLRETDAKMEELFFNARQSLDQHYKTVVEYWMRRYEAELTKRRELQATRSWRWTALFRKFGKKIKSLAGAEPEQEPAVDDGIAGMPEVVAMLDYVVERQEATPPPTIPDSRIFWDSPEWVVSPWSGGRVFFKGRVQDPCKGPPTAVEFQFNGVRHAARTFESKQTNTIGFEGVLELGQGLNQMQVIGLWPDGKEAHVGQRYLYFEGKQPGRLGTLDEGYLHFIQEVEPSLIAPPETASNARPMDSEGRPLFSILTPVFDPPIWAFEETVESVFRQLYQDWEWIIVNDASKNPALVEKLNNLSLRDERIRVIHREQNGHIARASNTGLAEATGDFVVLLDHDDLLQPEALSWFAAEIAEHPNLKMIYSDEDTLSESGKRYNPHLKPDYNPDLFLAHNTITHLAAFRRDRLTSMGGFRHQFVGAQDYDLMLRYLEGVKTEEVRHIPLVLYHWRSLEASTSRDIGAKPYAVESGRLALKEHISGLGFKVEVKALPQGGFYQVEWRHEKDLPPCVIQLDWPDEFPEEELWIQWLDGFGKGINELPNGSFVLSKPLPEEQGHLRRVLADWIQEAGVNWRDFQGSGANGISENMTGEEEDRTSSVHYIWSMRMGLVPSLHAYKELLGWLQLGGVGAVGGRSIDVLSGLVSGGLAVTCLESGPVDISKGNDPGDPGFFCRFICPQTVSVLTYNHILFRVETMAQLEVKAGFYASRDQAFRLLWTPHASLPDYHSPNPLRQENSGYSNDAMWPRCVIPSPRHFLWRQDYANFLK